MNDYNKIAELIFPNVALEYESPERNLIDGACVTRMAPSPTGFMHLGNLYAALIAERLAHQSGGVFFLRIEDTDQKREVEGAIDAIFTAFARFDLNFDEGYKIGGEYVPYLQSERREIYKIFAKKLLSEGKAYPCFCDENQLEEIKKAQINCGENTGYYGKWAKCRDLSFAEIESKIKAGENYIIRFKSQGDENKRIAVNDLIKGLLDPPENIRDEVILKSDGLPTYHFAHVVDDHLMRTTHVVRGEEWLSTLPIHVQFFEAFGWQHPNYLHNAQLLKLDENGNKRKLSKRSDPELALDFYEEKGYLPECLKEYIMTLLNSNYEEWRIANPDYKVAKMEDFKLTTEKLSASGALFDLNKLNDICKNYVALMTADELYERLIKWAKKFDVEFYDLLVSREDYAKKILAIGRGGAKPRKDFGLMSEIKNYMSYFYDELFINNFSIENDLKVIVKDYAEMYNQNDEQTVWFDKIKQLCVKYNFAPETKLYKKEPEKYIGSVGDLSMILRKAISGRENTPDLWEVMRILGGEKVKERLNHFAD